MIEKKRLDIAMVDLKLAPSREKAKAYIMSGNVYVDNEKCEKAGFLVSDKNHIEMRGEKLPFVSRGGLKLEKAIKKYALTLQDCICMDIGASTGGFTDCMLQSGAKKVYSIDVGYGQLAWKLRNDDRVVNLERTNFRYLTDDTVHDKIDFASVDVSFISLTIILPVLFRFLKQDGEAVVLVKPQFEAGKNQVGKNGVVRDVQVHKEVINKIYNLSLKTGFCVLDVDFSPIKGPKGNIEYLFYIKKTDSKTLFSLQQALQIADQSHQKIAFGG